MVMPVGMGGGPIGSSAELHALIPKRHRIAGKVRRRTGVSLLRICCSKSIKLSFAGVHSWRKGDVKIVGVSYTVVTDDDPAHSRRRTRARYRLTGKDPESRPFQS